MSLDQTMAEPPLIDNGVPAHFVTGCVVEHIGNGMLQVCFYRDEKSCGECTRQVECKIILHSSDIPAMRAQSDMAIREIAGPRNVRMM